MYPCKNSNLFTFTHTHRGNKIRLWKLILQTFGTCWTLMTGIVSRDYNGWIKRMGWRCKNVKLTLCCCHRCIFGISSGSVTTLFDVLYPLSSCSRLQPAEQRSLPVVFGFTSFIPPWLFTLCFSLCSTPAHVLRSLQSLSLAVLSLTHFLCEKEQLQYYKRQQLFSKYCTIDDEICKKSCFENSTSNYMVIHL